MKRWVVALAMLLSMVPFGADAYVSDSSGDFHINAGLSCDSNSYWVTVAAPVGTVVSFQYRNGTDSATHEMIETTWQYVGPRGSDSNAGTLDFTFNSQMGDQAYSGSVQLPVTCGDPVVPDVAVGTESFFELGPVRLYCYGFDNAGMELSFTTNMTNYDIEATVLRADGSELTSHTDTGVWEPASYSWQTELFSAADYQAAHTLQLRISSPDGTFETTATTYGDCSLLEVVALALVCTPQDVTLYVTASTVLSNPERFHQVVVFSSGENATDSRRFEFVPEPGADLNNVTIVLPIQPAEVDPAYFAYGHYQLTDDEARSLNPNDSIPVSVDCDPEVFTPPPTPMAPTPAGTEEPAETPAPTVAPTEIPAEPTPTASATEAPVIPTETPAETPVVTPTEPSQTPVAPVVPPAPTETPDDNIAGTLVITMPDGGSIEGSPYEVYVPQAQVQFDTTPYLTGVVGAGNTVPLPELPVGTYRLVIYTGAHGTIDTTFGIGDAMTDGEVFTVVLTAADVEKLPAIPVPTTPAQSAPAPGKTAASASGLPNTGAGEESSPNPLLLLAAGAAMIAALGGAAIRRSHR